MGFYAGFHRESLEIVFKALEFTIEQINREFNERKTKINPAHYGHLESERLKTLSSVKTAYDFFKHIGDNPYAVEIGEHQSLMSVIRSALEIYLTDVLSAIEITKSRGLQREALEINRLLTLEGIKEGTPDVFKEFVKPPSSPQEGEQIRVFISFRTNPDKKMAGKVKDELTNAGFNAFVAHDDIRKGDPNWPETLEKELRRCTFFVPVVTKDFNNSDWPNQETGFARALKKTIIPLLMGGELQGFLYITQGIKKDSIEKAIEELVKEIKLQATKAG